MLRKMIKGLRNIPKKRKFRKDCSIFSFPKAAAEAPRKSRE